jgi:YfiH family protein
VLSEERRGLRVYRFETLPEERFDCLVSTRIGGVSQPPYDSLNLGLRVEDDPSAVLANRRALFAAYDLSLEDSVWCKQVHKDSVRLVERSDAGAGALEEETIISDTDALITATPGIALCVTLADCVPVVIFDRRGSALGLVHAGWGGTVARIASRTVGEMREAFGSEPGELAAAIGPSIGPRSYEVGGEVIERAREVYGDRSAEILEFREGRAFFDLWRANAIDLEEAGLAAARIEIAGLSTAHALAEFYSHRLEKKTGRFIAAASLRA